MVFRVVTTARSRVWNLCPRAASWPWTRVEGMTLSTVRHKIPFKTLSKNRFGFRYFHTTPVLGSGVDDRTGNWEEGDTEAADMDDDDDNEGNETTKSEEATHDEAQVKKMLEEHYMLPSSGHNVLIIQPDVKIFGQRNKLTTAQMQLDEACALVDSLPKWTVAETMTFSLKKLYHLTVCGQGKFEEMTKLVRQHKTVTAVYFNMKMLTGAQLATLQKAFKVPVYDKYTIVLQIFMIRARTNEARLQVKLAELPYLRSRLRGIHMGTLQRQRGAVHSLTGEGESPLRRKLETIDRHETRLRERLARLKQKRDILKKQRNRKQIPSVAIVGYTNSGKTSLIKSLTGDAKITPMDKLFATLDVTVHAGLLPNMLKVLYVDTVGFISDIPTELIASFAATLEDMLTADVIVHVRDISNPNHALQKQNVEETLARLRLSSDLRESIIEVVNKVDKLSSPAELPEECLAISATTGTGLDLLREDIQKVLIYRTGRLKKKLKVKQGGDLFGWLRREVTVEAMEADPTSTEHLQITAIFTPAQWGRFQTQFVTPRAKKQPPVKLKMPP